MKVNIFINWLVWLFSGCPLYFAGISAGTAAGIAAGVGAAASAGGAIANGVSSGQASRAGQKASFEAYLRQLSGYQQAGNQYQLSRDQQNWAAQNQYNQSIELNQKNYNQMAGYNTDTLTNNNLWNKNQLKYSQQGLQGSYNSLMSGANNQKADYKSGFSNIKGYLNPYVKAGTNALSSQQDLLGLNGKAAQDSAYAGIQNGQYNNMLKQSENTLLQNSSATGGIRGGNAAAALAQLAPTQMQNAIDSRTAAYGGIANSGQQAATTLSGYRSQLGEQLAGVNGQIGQYGSAYKSGLAGLNNQYNNNYKDITQQNLAGVYGNNINLNTGNANAQMNYINSQAGNNSDYYNQLAGLYLQNGGAAAQQQQTSGNYQMQGILGRGNAWGQGLGAIGSLASMYGAYQIGQGGGYGGGGGGYQNWGYPSGSGGGQYGFAGLR